MFFHNFSYMRSSFLSPVSDDNIQKNMKQMKTEIKGLEKDLDKYKPVANVNDRFKSIMEISFTA